MIHSHGYWLDKEDMEGHRFDLPLAEAVLELVKYKVGGIIDIGCGNGSYTKHFLENDLFCMGYDGSPLTTEITNGMCFITDFSKPQYDLKFDLAFCLEVGEHIPKEYESIFIDNICRASNYVIMSWAVIGQGGNGHVNCQSNEYIISEFKKRGYEYDEAGSMFLRMKSTLGWFKHTILVFHAYH
jgi:hypothetical protein